MAEASKFMGYFGSKRKASSENETNRSKNPSLLNTNLA